MSLHYKNPKGVSIPIRRHTRQISQKTCSILEKFPREIMQKICFNLSTRSILDVSLTSKTLHLTCQGFIYQDLKIMDTGVVEPDPDELVIQNHFMTFKDEALEMDHWWIHLHETQIKSFKSLLLMLYNIIKIESFGLEVESIKIESKLKPNPFERCEIDRCVWESTLSDVLDPIELATIEKLEIGSADITLFQCLNMLISKCPNLTRLWVPYFPMKNVKLLLGCSFPNLIELKMMIYSNDEYCNIKGEKTQLNFANLKSLKKLRIMFQENTEGQLASLASTLSKTGIIQQLTELQMKYDKTDFNYLTKPTWFEFFKNLKTPLINLKRFKLKHCFFDNKQDELVKELEKIIPFEQLEWISLQIYEYSHKNLSCETDGIKAETVLMKLSPKLKSLKDLWIKGSNDCPSCQFKSISKSLKIFSKLEELIIFTNTSTQLQYNKLLSDLSKMKIDRLGFFDEFLNVQLIQWFKKHFLFEAGVKFDSFKNYLVETRRQERNTIFNGYIMDSFNEFNKREFEMICSFWIKYLPMLGLINLIIRSNEVKLFGYNFKCDRKRRVIMLYKSNDEGFKDLMYY